jgi:hypothetical protein
MRPEADIQAKLAEARVALSKVRKWSDDDVQGWTQMTVSILEWTLGLNTYLDEYLTIEE